MPNCVSEHCRREINPRWAFCAYCGQDNRPPEERYPVGRHRHRYEWSGRQRGYCTWCGQPADEPYAMTRAGRLRIAFTLIGLSVLFWLALLDVQLAHHGKPALFKDWILSWYDNLEAGGRSMWHIQGENRCALLAAGGVISALYGIWMLLKLPFRNRWEDREGCLGWLRWWS